MALKAILIVSIIFSVIQIEADEEEKCPHRAFFRKHLNTRITIQDPKSEDSIKEAENFAKGAEGRRESLGNKKTSFNTIFFSNGTEMSSENDYYLQGDNCITKTQLLHRYDCKIRVPRKNGERKWKCEYKGQRGATHDVKEGHLIGLSS